MTFYQDDGSITSAATRRPDFHACNCIGPQDGQPLCPCMMRGIIERDGRYIQPEKDLGAVRKFRNCGRGPLDHE